MWSSSVAYIVIIPGTHPRKPPLARLRQNNNFRIIRDTCLRSPCCTINAGHSALTFALHSGVMFWLCPLCVPSSDFSSRQCGILEESTINPEFVFVPALLASFPISVPLMHVTEILSGILSRRYEKLQKCK